MQGWKITTAYYFLWYFFMDRFCFFTDKNYVNVIAHELSNTSCSEIMITAVDGNHSIGLQEGFRYL